LVPTGEGLAQTPVGLGAAGSYAILAKTGVSSVPTSAVTGNIGSARGPPAS